MSEFERVGRNVLARFIGTVMPARKKDPASVYRELARMHRPKILLIRPHQGFGDLLLATPIFRGLQSAFPSAQLHFIADTYNFEAIKNNRRLHRVWIWDKKAVVSPRVLWRFVSGLRRERFDLAVIVSSHVPSFTSFLLAKASGAKTIWAFSTLPFYQGAVWSRWLANVEIPPPREEVPEFDKYMALVSPLGVRTTLDPEFFIPQEDLGAARVAWSKITGRGPRIGLFLAGNPDRPERLWIPSFWAQLALRLERELGANVIAIVTPPHQRSGSRADEPGFYDAVAKDLPFSLQRFADRSLTRVAAFLKDLQLFVVPDGGLFHIAAASHVPTVGLMIATDPNRWVPPVPWVSYLWAKGNASAITPDMAFAHIRERMMIKPKSVPVS